MPLIICKNDKHLVILDNVGQSEIDIKWNNDQNVKLVTQLMTGIRSFVRKWHNNIIPPTEKTYKCSQQGEGGKGGDSW